MKNLMDELFSLERNRTLHMTKLGEAKYAEIRNAPIDKTYIDKLASEILQIDKTMFGIKRKLDKMNKANQPIVCSNCGTNLTSEDKFCKECGSPTSSEEDQEAKVECLTCFAPLRRDDKFCNCCGNKAGEV